MFLKYVRAAREVLALPAFSTDAEGVYCDAIAPMEDAQAVAALRLWMRRFDRFPLPYEIREIATHLLVARAAQETAKAAHH